MPAQEKVDTANEYEPDHLVWHVLVEAGDENVLRWNVVDVAQPGLNRLPLSLAPGETLQDAWWRARLSDDKVSSSALAREAILAGRHYNQEYRCLMSDGSQRWFVEQARVESAGPNSWQITMVCTDVTELKMRLSMAQTRRAGVNYLVTHSLVWENSAGKIEWMHYLPDPENAPSFLPVTMEPGESYLDAFHSARLKADLVRMRLHGATHLRSNSSYTQEYRCYRADGEIRYLSEDVSVIRVAEGTWKLVTITTDISERRLLEQNLSLLVSGARCLIWYAKVRDVGSDLDWDMHFADEEAARRFLPINVASDQTFSEAWYHARPEEDNARMNALAGREIRLGRGYQQEFRIHLADGSVRWIEEHVQVETITAHAWRVIGVCTDITARKQQEELLRYIMAGAHCLLWYADAWLEEDGSIGWRPYIYDVDAAQRFLPVKIGHGETYYENWYWSRLEEDRLRTDAYGVGELLAGRSYSQEYRCRRSDGEIRWLSEYVTVNTLTTGRWKLVGVCTDVTERHVAGANLERQCSRLSVLFSISAVIALHNDIRTVLDILLGLLLPALQVDAAHILLLETSKAGADYRAGCGFRSQELSSFGMTADIRVVGGNDLGRTALFVGDLNIENPPFPWLQQVLVCEPFAAYAAIPLVVRGEVVGYLDLFHRSPMKMDAEWRDFAEALAGQTAVAIDNVALYENLQNTNSNLCLAYDATIEGWARALDLRDKETEGHSRRVTAMTIRLARALGVDDAELVYIRYGALLHDIGKMGIPDSILLKPGPLSATEWAVMHRHPTYAYEMLSPIAFLRAALEIPYCHHEKWDGSGYPRGLQGDAIPLAARIFAVVDVWDALRSDRPYRPAMDEETARDMIIKGRGTHFDPHIVDMFLSMQW